MARRELIVIALLAACKAKPDPECKAKADALVQTLRNADRSPRYPWGMTLVMTADGLIGRGARIELDGVARVLDAGRAGLSSKEVDQFGGGRGAAAVRIAPDVPWSRVAALADVLEEAGYSHPIFLVPRAPHAKPPPGPPPEPSQSVEDAVKVANKFVEQCKPLGKVFGRVSSTDEDLVETFIAGTGSALVECGCTVDMPALGSHLFNLVNDPEPAEPRALTLAKDGTPIALPAATPWKEAAKQLADGPIRLVAN